MDLLDRLKGHAQIHTELLRSRSAPDVFILPTWTGSDHRVSILSSSPCARVIIAARRRLNEHSRIATCGTSIWRCVYAHAVSDPRRALLALCWRVRTDLIGDPAIWQTLGWEAQSNYNMSVFKKQNGHFYFGVSVNLENLYRLDFLTASNLLGRTEKLDVVFAAQRRTQPRDMPLTYPSRLAYPRFVYPNNDFATRGGLSASPAPHLRILVLDCGRRWTANFQRAIDVRQYFHVLKQDLLEIPPALFVHGSSLRRLGLRGFAWPGDVLAVLHQLNDFEYDGPAVLSHTDLDALITAAPRLSNISIRCLRVHADFEPGTLGAPGLPSAAHVSRIAIGCTMHADSVLLDYWRARDAHDIVVTSLVGSSPFRGVLPQNARSISISVGGCAFHYPIGSHFAGSHRIRWCVANVGEMAAILMDPQPIFALHNLVSLSVHEFVFGQILNPPRRMRPQGHGVLPALKDITLWLSACYEWRFAADVMNTWTVTDTRIGSPLFLNGLRDNRGPSLLLPALELLSISAGLRPQDLESGPSVGRVQTHCGLPEQDECACTHYPTINLEDVRTFLMNYNLATLQLVLRICGLEPVDVDAASALVHLQSVVRDVQFTSDRVECEVCPIKVGDVYDAPTIFQVLEGH